MPQPILTNEQGQAAGLRGRSLLVSAAAGSGKTFVLVQRLMEDIQKGADITDYLIITYTRAAASELRAKIQKELYRRLSENGSGDLGRHLRRQLLLLPQSSIGTIHGFCSNLLREHASELELSPDFRIMDETEASERKNKALDSVLERAYAGESQQDAFYRLAEMMVQTRGDEDLKKAVLDVYENLRSMPDPEGWMRHQRDLACLDGVTDVSETLWGRSLMQHTQKVIAAVKPRWQFVAETLRRDYKPCKWADSMEALVARLTELEAALEQGWDRAAALFPLNFGRAMVGKGEDAADLKLIHQSCKDLMESEQALYTKSSKALLEDMKAVSRETAAFYDLVLDFEEQFKADKLHAGRLDYSDLEHLSLKLLYTMAEGNMLLTQTASATAERYREVLIDEYQDVNQVQEMILKAVSRHDTNRFMVGDMKQSIYRFRMADVRIFKEKYLHFDKYDGKEGDAPVKVLLPDNFRSSKGVVDGVNAVFRALMSEAVGELEYGPCEELRFGRKCPEDHAASAELVRIGDADAIEMKSEDRRPMEARAAAQKIRDMMENRERIWDKKPDTGEDYQRLLKYEDFAILLRSTKDVEAIYQAALTEYGIPYCTLAGDPWFTSPEVELILDCLSIIDNPRQDLPLIHVLQSPLFGFSFDLLAELRTQSKNGDFYDALLVSRDHNEMCDAFLSWLEEYRKLAVRLTAEEVLWRLLEQTHAKALLAAAGMSGAVEGNLNHLLEYAAGFESDGYRGLFPFNRHIRFLQENGKEPPGSETAKGSGVHIMTIHKSKGLEYPVVLLCDTEHGFNQSDSTKPVLFHKELGIGLYRRDRSTMRQYPTMARRAIVESLRRETISEEMRVLYVALTRAKDRLVVMLPPYYLRAGSKDNSDKTTEEVLAQPSWQASPLCVGSQTNYRAWLLTAVLQNPRIREQIKDGVPAEGYPWRITRIVPDGRRANLIPEESNSHPLQEIEITPDDIRHRISRTYAYALSTEIPAKLTATELKGTPSAAETAEDAEALLPKTRPIRKPDFSGGMRPLTGSERGTAMHSAMQYLPYHRCLNAGALENELHLLVEKEFLTQAQADAVNRDALLKLFQSELGMRIAVNAGLHREFKFSVLTPSETLLPETTKEPILLQGVVDCWLEEEDGLVVVDFKTDHITEDNFEQKCRDYANQLRLYAIALERMTGKPVKEAIVYFFSINRAVSVLKKEKK